MKDNLKKAILTVYQLVVGKITPESAEIQIQKLLFEDVIRHTHPTDQIKTAKIELLKTIIEYIGSSMKSISVDRSTTEGESNKDIVELIDKNALLSELKRNLEILEKGINESGLKIY